MEDVISKLRQERAALKLRIEKVENAIAEYERWAMSVADIFEVDQQPTASAVQPQTLEPVGSAQGEDIQQSPISEFEDSVKIVLEDAEHPYQRGMLLAAIESLGITISGKSPTNTLGTRLSRMDEIINLKGHGYWLRARPYPPAGYMVDNEKEIDDGSDDLI